MRKQLNEIRDIENYLTGSMDASERFLFDVKCLVSDELKKNTIHQKAAYSLIRWFGRRKRRQQLDSLFSTLMNDKSFSSTVYSIFR